MTRISKNILSRSEGLSFFFVGGGGGWGKGALDTVGRRGRSHTAGPSCLVFEFCRVLSSDKKLYSLCLFTPCINEYPRPVREK